MSSQNISNSILKSELINTCYWLLILNFVSLYMGGYIQLDGLFSVYPWFDRVVAIRGFLFVVLAWGKIEITTREVLRLGFKAKGFFFGSGVLDSTE